MNCPNNINGINFIWSDMNFDNSCLFIVIWISDSWRADKTKIERCILNVRIGMRALCEDDIFLNLRLFSKFCNIEFKNSLFPYFHASASLGWWYPQELKVIRQRHRPYGNNCIKYTNFTAQTGLVKPPGTEILLSEV